MIPDAECLKIVHEILSQLDLGEFRIKVWLRWDDGGGGRGLPLRALCVVSRSTTDASWTACLPCAAFPTTSSAPSAPQWTSWTRWGHWCSEQQPHWLLTGHHSEPQQHLKLTVNRRCHLSFNKQQEPRLQHCYSAQQQLHTAGSSLKVQCEILNWIYHFYIDRNSIFCSQIHEYNWKITVYFIYYTMYVPPVTLNDTQQM